MSCVESYGFVRDDLLWEDMPDDELAEWVERVTHAKLTIPMSEYDE
jgi:hypothetical protein